MSEPLKLDVETLFERHPHARTVLERLVKNGHEALLVGGVVRDGVLSLLGQATAFERGEVDVATSAAPEAVAALFPGWPSHRVGKAFGVLLLIAPDGMTYEIATFRTESGYDGRKPKQINLARSFAEDVRRRDFTMNGLAARMDGSVVDLVGGVDDLKRNVIRTIGPPADRFAEDHLRLLRAVRFGCKLGFDIASEVQAAIRRQAALVQKLSAERVRDELWKMLQTQRAHQGIEQMAQLELLPHVLPEVSALQNVPQPAKYHPEGDVFVHTLLALRWADKLGVPPLSKFAVLCHDIGKPQALEQNQGEHMGGHEHIGARMVNDIGQRLRLSRADLEVLRWTTEHHMRIAKLPEMGRAKRLRFLQAGLSQRPDHPHLKLVTLLHLLVCDAQASVHRSQAWLPVFKTVTELCVRLKEIQRKEAAHRLLDGRDVLALGVAPGPVVGEILTTVYDQILAGQIQTRQQALKAAAKHVANLTSS